jgi:hypothetical protein
MNQVFNFHRFGLLLKLDFAENGKRNILSFVVIFALMLLLMNPFIDYESIQMEATFLHILALGLVMFCGSLLTSISFSKYSESSQGIAAISLPASQTEKFLAILLINLIFMTILIGLFLWLHFTFADMIIEMYPNKRVITKLPLNVTLLMVFLFFLIQGSTFLGSIYFTKSGYIKTASILLGVVIIIFFVNSAIVTQLTNGENYVQGVPFSSWNFSRQGRYYTAESGGAYSKMIKAFLGLAVVSLWYIAYVRLKEKEI